MKFTPQEDLQKTIKRVYDQGLTTMSGGNLSIRDSQGTYVTPARLDKASLKPQDMMVVDNDGNVSGYNKLTSEYVVHKAILDKNPNLKAVLHAHPSSLLGFSAARILPNPTIMANSIRLLKDKIAMAKYVQPGTPALATVTADTLTNGITIAILENHGLFIVEKDQKTAYHLLEELDLLSKVQMSAKLIDAKGAKSLSQESMDALLSEKTPSFNKREMTLTNQEKEAAEQLVAFTKRMYRRGLTTCLSGSYSVKVDNVVLITPKDVDLNELTVDDIVRISDNVISNNASPSNDVKLHLEIYAQNDDVSSIVMASPRYMMSYGVVSQTLKSRVIPECYFLLTKVDSIPFGVGEPFNKKVAKHFNEQQPTLLVQHDKYIVTASSIMLAYDRLEVAEATAEGLITTLPLAPLVEIPQVEIEKFDKMKFPHLIK